MAANTTSTETALKVLIQCHNVIKNFLKVKLQLVQKISLYIQRIKKTF